MQIVSGIAVYFIIWWMVFFLVLTVGNRDPVPDDAQVLGNERGAPAQARIWRRILWTTGLAVVGFLALYALLNSGITLQDIPLPHAPGT